MLYVLAYVAGLLTVPVARSIYLWFWWKRHDLTIDLSQRPDLYDD